MAKVDMFIADYDGAEANLRNAHNTLASSVRLQAPLSSVRPQAPLPNADLPPKSTFSVISHCVASVCQYVCTYVCHY